MDYKEKVIALLNSQELSNEQKEKLESIFPELKESEDERIRKGIISGMKALQEKGKYTRFANIPMDNIFAWLEKQGEQKSKVTPKFNIGDTIWKKTDHSNRITILSIDEYFYYANSYNIIIDIADKEWELVEQKPAWSEEDEEIIEALISLCDVAKDFIPQLSALKNWLKSLKDRVQPQLKQGEQNLVLRDTFGYEDGRLFGTNEGIGLVLDNPEKYGLQKPVKWSKEDENVISLILSICNDFLESFKISPASTKVVKEDVDKIENWLKSLRPQSHWKPNDKQMKAIEHICDGNFNVDLDILDSIYRDFKKLRKE